MYRDYIPDVLVACDSHMLKEILQAGHKPWSRSMWVGHIQGDFHVLPDLPFKDESNWGTGAYATLLACMSEAETIYFVGFDLYTENMYKGTENYFTDLDPSLEIHQLEKLFDSFDKEFVFILPEGQQRCTEWERHENVTYTSSTRCLFPHPCS